MLRPARLAAALLVALAAPIALANEIGTVAAVNADVTGTPPAAGTRVLQLSDDLVQDELIVSSETGSAQLLFLDQSSLTVSPRSNVVLDSYVYDPGRAQPEITLDMTKGVLRFIGGRITKQSDATVRTPIATIGIRGGIALSSVTDELVRIVHVAGEYTRASCPGGDLSCKGPPVTVSRPNAVIEARPGEPPKFVGIASPQDIAEIYDALSVPGGGGARNIGTLVAAFGQNGGAVPTGGSTPYLNPISTTGESTVSVTPLVLESEGADNDYRTLAFSDPQFLNAISGTTGDFLDVGGTGLVRGQLTWRNSADLDLHLFLPNDAGEVAFFNPTIVFNNGQATATLDADNLGGTINVQPDIRVENIVVNGQVPAGTYDFLVDNFSSNGNALTDFRLVMTPDGGLTTQTATGSLGSGQDSGRIPLIVGSQPGS